MIENVAEQDSTVAETTAAIADAAMNLGKQHGAGRPGALAGLAAHDMWIQWKAGLLILEKGPGGGTVIRYETCLPLQVLVWEAGEEESRQNEAEITADTVHVLRHLAEDPNWKAVGGNWNRGVVQATMRRLQNAACIIDRSLDSEQVEPERLERELERIGTRWATTPEGSEGPGQSTLTSRIIVPDGPLENKTEGWMRPVVDIKLTGDRTGLTTMDMLAEVAARANGIREGEGNTSRSWTWRLSRLARDRALQEDRIGLGRPAWRQMAAKQPDTQ